MEAPSLSLVFRLPHERLLGQRRDGSPLNLTYHTFNKLQRIEGEANVIEPRTPLYIENPRRVFSAETGIHTRCTYTVPGCMVAARLFTGLPRRVLLGNSLNKASLIRPCCLASYSSSSPRHSRHTTSRSYPSFSLAPQNQQTPITSSADTSSSSTP